MSHERVVRQCIITVMLSDHQDCKQGVELRAYRNEKRQQSVLEENYGHAVPELRAKTCPKWTTGYSVEHNLNLMERRKAY